MRCNVNDPGKLDFRDISAAAFSHRLLDGFKLSPLLLLLHCCVSASATNGETGDSIRLIRLATSATKSSAEVTEKRQHAAEARETEKKKKSS